MLDFIIWVLSRGAGLMIIMGMAYVAVCWAFDLPLHPGKLYRDDDHRADVQRRRTNEIQRRNRLRKNLRKTG